jgi:hypothetical protein
MAVETGFAESHTDLLNKLRIFVTGLSPSTDRWVAERNVTTSGMEELILSSDNIYVGLKAYSDPVADNFGLILNGFTGFNSLLSFYEQPGGMTLSELPPVLPLLKSNPVNSNAIKYWFIADGFSIKIIARTGTGVYHQAYLGFYTTYGTPPQYPYPLCVGGSGLTNNSGIPSKQNDNTTATNAYWKPQDAFNSSTITLHIGTLAIKDPGGAFRRIIATTGGTGTSACTGTWPFIEEYRGFLGGFVNMRNNLDGRYSTQPIMIIDGNPSNIFGEFTGVRHVTGYQLNSEDTLTLNSETWVCFQNVSKTGDGEMVAYRYV